MSTTTFLKVCKGAEPPNANSVQLTHCTPKEEQISDTLLRKGAEKGSARRDHLMFHRASDSELLLAAQSGVQQAFGELCRRHTPKVQKRIRSIVRNQHDAEDVLQDTLLRAYTHLDSFRGRCNFSTWITRIGINSALMLLRRRKARAEIQAAQSNEDILSFVTEEYADASPNPEQMLAKYQTRLLLNRELQKLQPAFRIIIEKHYGSESSLAETADTLGMSVPAAKARLFRGRHALRSSLGRNGIFSSGT